MKKKFINEKSLTIYTILIYVLAILVYEIGYCNSDNVINIINRNGIQYNFSLCRIVVYFIFMVVFFVSRKIFISEVISLNENKLKTVLIISSLILTPIVIVLALCVAYFYPINIKIISIGILAVLMGNICLIYLSNNIIKNIIVISATLGILFTITTRFNHCLDEKKHFMSAFNLSFRNLDYVNNPITDKQIEELPQLSRVGNVNDFLKKTYKPNITNDVNMEDVPSTPASYNPILYACPALGILFARILQGNIIDLYIMGRLFNLIEYTILICLAIKILPFKKNVFYTIFLLPMSLLLAASYSIDGMCIACVALFIAYCLKLKKERETITLKDFIILSLMFIVLLLAKSMAYVGVALIVLMLPLIATLKKNKKYIPIIVVSFIIVFVCLSFLALYIKNTKITDDTRCGTDISVQRQLDNMIKNPIFDIRLMLIHMRDTLLNINWYQALHMKELFTKNASLLFIPITLYILYVAITEDDYNFKIKDKLIMLISYLFVFAMTSVVLYISCTPVGSFHVGGFQARYMLPIIPLILMSLSFNRVEYKKNENRNFNIAIISLILILISILQDILA